MDKSNTLKSDANNIPLSGEPVDWLPVETYYENVDCEGNNKRFPVSLKKKFVYEPNIISEKLIIAQRFLYENHKSLDNLLNQTVNGVFYLEKGLSTTFRWFRDDLPPLIPPCSQTLTLTGASCFLNRSRPLYARLLLTSGMGIFVGFLSFPSWRRQLDHLYRQKVLTLVPPLQTFEDTLSKSKMNTVNGLVNIWNKYDQLKDAFRLKRANIREGIIAWYRGRPS